MKYSVVTGPTLYRRFVRDDTDLPTIKAALSDFQADGFTIDSDPEQAEKFETKVFPAWCRVGDECDAWIENMDFSVPRPREAISTFHFHDGTCVGFALIDYQENFYSHRYSAVSPEFRGQHKFMAEHRRLGLITCFDICQADAMQFQRETNMPFYWRGMEISTVIDATTSMGRGTLREYNVNQIAMADWESFKADESNDYNSGDYGFEWRFQNE